MRERERVRAQERKCVQKIASEREIVYTFQFTTVCPAALEIYIYVHVNVYMSIHRYIFVHVNMYISHCDVSPPVIYIHMKCISMIYIYVHVNLYMSIYGYIFVHVNMYTSHLDV